ncbi:MAG: hypothetical protein RL598_1392 [Verrucomicrobiota bacterium]|jgi:uncharacterized membrane protein YphA (DoxX/SURF4 family)|nr:MAG: hypothetical protein B9S28_00430 [Opitutae bacterium Tous-C10FEB]
MQTITSILQVVIALGLFNVWLLRFSQSTPYRGGAAGTMPEEFLAYGLPRWSTYLVGLLKIGAGLALIIGLWHPHWVLPAALLIVGLMVGAIFMHFRIRDPLKKNLPALVMLILSVSLSLITAA